ncbi:hypothetical protein QAD02_008406 [Eretmocerus hayati]|uniref:Uncharacterized protein n=1 Tax=Eretmocerus hayati TaxID=131215 RepID=A0ACC2N6B8_9HYME|nr:hypothetical protein QAD02_008406 [Eretmocerus hayati]
MGDHEADITDILVQEEAINPKGRKLYRSCRVNPMPSEAMHLAKALKYNNCDKDLEASFQCTNLHLLYEVRGFRSLSLIKQSLPKPKVTEFYYCLPCENNVNFASSPPAECSECGVMYEKKVLKKEEQCYIT